MTDTKGNNVVDRSKYDYEKTRVKTKSGKVRHSVTNGDAIAQALFGLEPDDLVKIGKANGKEIADKIGRPEDAKNIGMFRMKVGNILRAQVRKGNPMKVGDLTIKKLDQKVPKSEAVKAAEEQAKELSKQHAENKKKREREIAEKEKRKKERAEAAQKRKEEKEAKKAEAKKVREEAAQKRKERDTKAA